MKGKGKRENRTSMREGDRILINKGISKKVFIVARVDVPHSNERVFVSKSGGKYTIGLKVWKTDYAWSEKKSDVGAETLAGFTDWSTGGMESWRDGYTFSGISGVARRPPRAKDRFGHVWRSLEPTVGTLFFQQGTKSLRRLI